MTILELAARFEGVTLTEARTATGRDGKVLAGKITKLTKQGRLHRIKSGAHVLHWFTTLQAGLTWAAQAKHLAVPPILRARSTVRRVRKEGVAANVLAQHLRKQRETVMSAPVTVLPVVDPGVIVPPHVRVQCYKSPKFFGPGALVQIDESTVFPDGFRAMGPGRYLK